MISMSGRAVSGLRGKRVFDLVVVIALAPFWLPVLGGLAALVAICAGRPVLFRQARPGRAGVVFELCKFRTMTNARDARGGLLPDAERMTRFGRWLRASSLDG